MDEKEVVVVVVANGPTHHIPLPPFFGCDTSQQQHISTQKQNPFWNKKRGNLSAIDLDEWRIFHLAKGTIPLTNQLNDEATSSVATNRQGASLSLDGETAKIFKKEAFASLLKKVAGDPSMHLTSNLPVEVRLYEKTGSSMAWHEDDILNVDPNSVLHYRRRHVTANFPPSDFSTIPL
jgi:hypothetical protein